MKKNKRKERRQLSNKALRASGNEIDGTIRVPLENLGDLAIFIRAPDSDRFEPFDGKGIGEEPMRWPFLHRQHVNAIAQSLAETNPGYEVEVRHLPDTAYEEFDSTEYRDSYRADLKGMVLDGPRTIRKAKGQTDIGSFGSVEPDVNTGANVADLVGQDTLYQDTDMETYARRYGDPRYSVPYEDQPDPYVADPFDDPLYEPEYYMPDAQPVPIPASNIGEPPVENLGGFVTASEIYRAEADAGKGKRSKTRAGKGSRRRSGQGRSGEIVSAPPENYSTQTYTVEVITGKLTGRATPSAKANSVGDAIVTMTDGETIPLKQTIRNGVYYAVVESGAPAIGETRRVLVSGRVQPHSDGRLHVELHQSDTGSPFMDVPKTYIPLLDMPYTDQDSEYRRKLDERFAGDGRPWDDRRYTVDGRDAPVDTVVAKLSKYTGRTDRDVLVDPSFRGMRVHDSIDMGGEGRLVRTFGRRVAR